MSKTKVLLIGANRGIGLEMAKLLQARGDEVMVTCRTATDELRESGVAFTDGVDVTEQSGIDRLSAISEGNAYGLVVCMAGLLENNALGSLSVDSLRRQYEINAIAPLRIAELLRGNMPSGSKLALISSRMGSMDDNDSGGCYGYRMSKAALNAAGKSLSIDLQPAGIAVGLFHPGWVRTAMTGFAGNLDPDECAALLAQRMDELTLENAGRFVHAQGEILPW